MLPSAYRLHREQDINRLYKRALVKGDGELVMYSAPNRLRQSRFVIVTPKKVGKAHDRNRLKRMLKASILLQLRQIVNGSDIVVHVKPQRLDKHRQEMDVQLRQLLQRSNLWTS